MINIDEMIKIGFKHVLCEDAVKTGREPYPYLIVSDGCSSSEETHIGSNIIVKSAEYIIKNCLLNYKIDKNFAKKIGLDIIERANNISKKIPLNEMALDATLLIAFIIEKKLYFICYGDGNVIIKDNGIEVYKTYSQECNMPDYLSYFLNEDRKNRYLEIAKEKVQKKETLSYSFEIKSECFNYTLEEYNTEKLDYFIISTDGIESFFDGKEFKKIKNIGLNKFKNLNGLFLKRRLNKIIKENSKNNIFNQDDIGVAGFSFQELGEDK